MIPDWLALARDVALQIDDPTGALWWGYMGSATAIAALVYVHRRPGGRVSLAGFGRFAFPRSEAWRRSWHDVALFAINTAAFAVLVLATVQLLGTAVAQRVWLGLHETLGPVSSPWTGVPARVAMTLATLILMDLAFFASHWLHHRVGFLWEFHKVHHSAQVLHPFTVARRHPVEVIVELSILSTVLGVLHGVSGWLSGGALEIYRVLGVNALLFFFLLVFNLQHSHVWISFGPLDRLFISPAAHQLHHSANPQHFGNYGNVLALWDGMFGTLRRPTRASQPVRFGLERGEDREYGSLVRLYALPFLKAVRRLRTRSS